MDRPAGPDALQAEETAVSVKLVVRLMAEFGADAAYTRTLSELGTTLGEALPELVAAMRRADLLSHAEDGLGRPLLGRGMSEAQRALLAALLRGQADEETLAQLLARWAADLQPQELGDRIRLDCQRLHALLRESIIRVFGIDTARCGRMLDAVERLAFLQVAVQAAFSERRARAAFAPADFGSFIAQVAAQVEARRAQGGGLAVMLVDCGLVARLDGLCGYEVGDEARGRIVQRLRSGVLRAGDKFGELGRDEFAFVLSALPSPGVAQLAAQKVLAALANPVTAGDIEIYAHPAVGIALFPEHGDVAGTLLLRAKMAAQAARDTIERFAFYSPQQESPDAQQLLLENRLRTAVDDGRLELVFQPQFDALSRAVVGAESLLRWRDSDLGPISPNRAISVAESAGLMNEVTWWIISNAVRQCAQFRASGLDLSVSINVSPNNLREPDLPDFIDRALRTWDVPAEHIVIEITETAMVSMQEAVVSTLSRLKAVGVRLSIDDFGTGYSSLYYLATMPLDEVKIDLSFVRDMLRVPQHERIVRSVIDLAHSLSLSVVAEGVEDAEVWERLATLGCDRIQGYFGSRPLAAPDLVERFGRGPPGS